jgi:hypothetical protein
MAKDADFDNGGTAKLRSFWVEFNALPYGQAAGCSTGKRA